jgi:hypothetical protein
VSTMKDFEARMIGVWPDLGIPTSTSRIASGVPRFEDTYQKGIDLIRRLVEHEKK